nr:hypothetical protein BaRGS_019663 [Batillaria attramentaria]
MTADDIPRQIVGMRMEYDVPDVKESLMYDSQKLAIDAACFMGRSFRVGWGLGGRWCTLGLFVLRKMKVDALHRYASESAANTIKELDDDAERGGYTECQARREALSRWLSSAAQRKIQAEVAASAYQATDFIREQRQRVYCLLAGQLLWGGDGQTAINTCFGMDWKRALALHLWYQCQPNSPIAEAVKRWHLWNVLQALGFGHLSEYQGASIHMNYAAQLESLGLWHWAVLPLLHIHDTKQREHAIRELLGRHIQLSTKPEYLEKENFVLQRLLLPPAWIHSAKAVRARYLHKYSEEAEQLLRAGRWNQAHQVIVTHLAADAIVNENHKYIMSYLDELAVPERSITILNWNTSGKVYHDYVTLLRTVDNMKESQMAQQAITMLRTVITMHSPGSESVASTTELLAQAVTSLPMPEDYMLQELRELVRGHMLEVTH